MSNSTEILAPFLPKIMDGLLTMATQSTDDVLALVLESLRIVMSVSRLLSTLHRGAVYTNPDAGVG